LSHQPWQIQIQHPRQQPSILSTPLATIPLSKGGLATSGDYERYFIHEGKRYCHILNPHTGWPVSYWQSVSIVGANATTAGALSTLSMLKGAHAPAWLEAQGAHYLAVRHDGLVFKNKSATQKPSHTSLFNPSGAFSCDPPKSTVLQWV